MAAGLYYYCQVCQFEGNCISEHLRSKLHKLAMSEFFKKEVFPGPVHWQTISYQEDYLRQYKDDQGRKKENILGLSLVTLCLSSEKRDSLVYLCHVCEESVSNAKNLRLHLQSIKHCCNYYNYNNPKALRFSWIPCQKIELIVDPEALSETRKYLKLHSGSLKVLDLPPTLFETVKGTSYVKVMATLSQNDNLLKQITASRPKQMTIQTYLGKPNRKNPLLGLEHLVECSCEDQPDRRFYLCTVCKLTLSHTKIIKHLLSFDHIHDYINAWHPLTLMYSCYEYDIMFHDMMQDLAKQMEGIHGTTITDMKQVILEPALFSSVEGTSYVEALEMLEDWRKERKESSLITSITPGEKLVHVPGKLKSTSHEPVSVKERVDATEKEVAAQRSHIETAKRPVRFCKLSCQVCHVKLETTSQYFAHMEGREHKQRMKTIFMTEADELDKPVVHSSVLMNEWRFIEREERSEPVIGLLHIVMCATTRASYMPLCVCTVCQCTFLAFNLRDHLVDPLHIKHTLMHQNPARLPFTWKGSECEKLLTSLAWEEEKAQGPEHMVLKIIDLPSRVFMLLSKDYSHVRDMLDEHFCYEWLLEGKHSSSSLSRQTDAFQQVGLPQRLELGHRPQLGLQFMVLIQTNRGPPSGSLCLLCERKLHKVELSSHVFRFEHIKAFLNYAHPGSLDCDIDESSDKLLDLAKQAEKIHPTGCMQRVTLSSPVRPYTYRNAFKILQRQNKMDGHGQLIPVFPEGEKLDPEDFGSDILKMTKKPEGDATKGSPDVMDHTPLHADVTARERKGDGGKMFGGTTSKDATPTVERDVDGETESRSPEKRQWNEHSGSEAGGKRQRLSDGEEGSAREKTQMKALTDVACDQYAKHKDLRKEKELVAEQETLKELQPNTAPQPADAPAVSEVTHNIQVSPTHPQGLQTPPPTSDCQPRPSPLISDVQDKDLQQPQVEPPTEGCHLQVTEVRSSTSQSLKATAKEKELVVEQDALDEHQPNTPPQHVSDETHNIQVSPTHPQGLQPRPSPLISDVQDNDLQQPRVESPTDRCHLQVTPDDVVDPAIKNTALWKYCKGTKGTEPLIGLSMMKNLSAKHSTVIRFHCQYCSSDFSRSDLFSHVTSAEHRYNYIKKVHPHLIHDWPICVSLDKQDWAIKLRDLAQQLVKDEVLDTLHGVPQPEEAPAVSEVTHNIQVSPKHSQGLQTPPSTSDCQPQASPIISDVQDKTSSADLQQTRVEPPTDRCHLQVDPVDIMDPAATNTALWRFLNSTERTEPVIGLSMMTDFQWPEHSARNCFRCFCCSRDILHSQHMSHMVSASHRFNYIGKLTGERLLIQLKILSEKKVHPHMVHDWPSSVEPGERPRELRDLAQQVERDEGWGTLKVKVMGSSKSQALKATTRTPLTADGNASDVSLKQNEDLKMNVISMSVAELTELSNSCLTDDKARTVSKGNVVTTTSHTDGETMTTSNVLPTNLKLELCSTSTAAISNPSTSMGVALISISAISKSTGAMSHLTQTTSSATQIISRTTTNSNPTAHMSSATPALSVFSTTISKLSTTTAKPSKTDCHSATVMSKPTATISNTTPEISKLSNCATDKLAATPSPIVTGACDTAATPKTKVASKTKMATKQQLMTTSNVLATTSKSVAPSHAATISSVTSTISNSTGAKSHLTQTTSSATPAVSSFTANSKPTAHISSATPAMFESTTTISKFNTSPNVSKSTTSMVVVSKPMSAAATPKNYVASKPSESTSKSATNQQLTTTPDVLVANTKLVITTAITSKPVASCHAATISSATSTISQTTRARACLTLTTSSATPTVSRTTANSKPTAHISGATPAVSENTTTISTSSTSTTSSKPSTKICHSATVMPKPTAAISNTTPETSTFSETTATISKHTNSMVVGSKSMSTSDKLTATTPSLTVTGACDTAATPKTKVASKTSESISKIATNQQLMTTSSVLAINSKLATSSPSHGTTISSVTSTISNSTGAKSHLTQTNSCATPTVSRTTVNSKPTAHISSATPAMSESTTTNSKPTSTTTSKPSTTVCHSATVMSKPTATFSNKTPDNSKPSSSTTTSAFSEAVWQVFWPILKAAVNASGKAVNATPTVTGACDTVGSPKNKVTPTLTISKPTMSMGVVSKPTSATDKPATTNTSSLTVAQSCGTAVAPINKVSSRTSKSTATNEQVRTAVSESTTTISTSSTSTTTSKPITTVCHSATVMSKPTATISNTTPETSKLSETTVTISKNTNSMVVASKSMSTSDKLATTTPSPTVTGACDTAATPKTKVTSKTSESISKIANNQQLMTTSSVLATNSELATSSPSHGTTISIETSTIPNSTGAKSHLTQTTFSATPTVSRTKVNSKPTAHISSATPAMSESTTTISKPTSTATSKPSTTVCHSTTVMSKPTATFSNTTPDNSKPSSSTTTSAFSEAVWQVLWGDFEAAVSASGKAVTTTPTVTGACDTVCSPKNKVTPTLTISKPTMSMGVASKPTSASDKPATTNTSSLTVAQSCGTAVAPINKVTSKTSKSTSKTATNQQVRTTSNELITNSKTMATTSKSVSPSHAANICHSATVMSKPTAIFPNTSPTISKPSTSMGVVSKPVIVASAATPKNKVPSKTTTSTSKSATNQQGMTTSDVLVANSKLNITTATTSKPVAPSHAATISSATSTISKSTGARSRLILTTSSATPTVSRTTANSKPTVHISGAPAVSESTTTISTSSTSTTTSKPITTVCHLPKSMSTSDKLATTTPSPTVTGACDTTATPKTKVTSKTSESILKVATPTLTISKPTMSMGVVSKPTSASDKPATTNTSSLTVAQSCGTAVAPINKVTSRTSKSIATNEQVRTTSNVLTTNSKTMATTSKSVSPSHAGTRYSVTSAISKSTEVKSLLTQTTSSANPTISRITDNSKPISSATPAISKPTSTTTSKPVYHSATVMSKPTATFSNTNLDISKSSKSTATISKRTTSMGAVSKVASTSGKRAATSSATSAISESTGAKSCQTLTTCNATPTISRTTANSKPTAHISSATPPMSKSTATISKPTTSTSTSKPNTTPAISGSMKSLWKSLEAPLVTEAASKPMSASGKAATTSSPTVTGACDAATSNHEVASKTFKTTDLKLTQTSVTATKAHCTLTTCQTTKEDSKTVRTQTSMMSNRDDITLKLLLSLATAVSPASTCGSSPVHTSICGSSPVETSESTRRSKSKINGPAVGLNFLVCVSYKKRIAIYCQLCKTKAGSKHHRFGSQHRSNYVRFKRPELTEDLSDAELLKIATELAMKDMGDTTQMVKMKSEREYEELTKAEVPEALAKIKAILRRQRESQDSPSATNPQPESLKHQDMSTGLHEPSHHPDGNKANHFPDPLATGSQSSTMHTLPTDTRPESPQSCDVQIESSEDDRAQHDTRTQTMTLHDTSTQPMTPEDTRTQPAESVTLHDTRTQPVTLQDSIRHQGGPQGSREHQEAPPDPGRRQQAPLDSDTPAMAPQCSGTSQKAAQHPDIQPQNPEPREMIRIKLEETQKPLERPDRQTFLDSDSGHQQPVFQTLHRSNSGGELITSRVSSCYLKVKLSEAERNRVVGLSSVLECQCGDVTERLFPFYMCRSCQETVQLNHICRHVISTDHQVNYMWEKCHGLMAEIRNQKDWNEKQKMEGSEMVAIKVAEREQFLQMDAEVILLDKNSYHRIQAAPYSEGINILEDMWRQQTSSCPPADQQPPEVTDNKENVRLNKSLIETTPIAVAIVKTEPIPEPLTTLNTHSSNITATIKQEVKQEDHAHSCFSGHTEMRKTVKHGLDYMSMNGDGETVKRRRISKSPDGRGTRDSPSGPCSDISSPASECPSPQHQEVKVKVEPSHCPSPQHQEVGVKVKPNQCPSPQNQEVRVKVEPNQCPSPQNQEVRVKVEPNQCPSPQNQEARVKVENSRCPSPQHQEVKVETTSVPTTLVSQTPHCEPSQMWPQPKLQLVLNSLKTLASSNFILECSPIKPASDASAEPSTTPLFIDSSLAKRESQPVLQSTISEVKPASPTLTLNSVIAVPLSPPVNMPSSEPITSIVKRFRHTSSVGAKQFWKDVSPRQEKLKKKKKKKKKKKITEIVAMTSKSTHISVGRVKPRIQLDSKCQIPITKPNQNINVLKFEPATIMPTDDTMNYENRQFMPESVAAKVVDEVRSPESRYTTAIQTNTAQVLQHSNSAVSPLQPGSQQFNDGDYRINQPTVATVRPWQSLPSPGYGTPVDPYGQVTQTPYFTRGYPSGTGTQNNYMTQGQGYLPSTGTQNAYFAHGYPQGTETQKHNLTQPYPSGTATQNYYVMHGYPPSTGTQNNGYPSGTGTQNNGYPSGTGTQNNGYPSGTGTQNNGYPPGTGTQNNGYPPGTGSQNNSFTHGYWTHGSAGIHRAPEQHSVFSQYVNYSVPPPQMSGGACNTTNSPAGGAWPDMQRQQQ